jgi:hypothetical protein
MIAGTTDPDLPRLYREALAAGRGVSKVIIASIGALSRSLV